MPFGTIDSRSYSNKFNALTNGLGSVSYNSNPYRRVIGTVDPYTSQQLYDNLIEQQRNYSYLEQEIKIYESKKNKANLAQTNLKVKKNHMPRIIRLSLYFALVYTVWNIVLNLNTISLFIVNLITNHGK